MKEKAKNTATAILKPILQNTIFNNEKLDNINVINKAFATIYDICNNLNFAGNIFKIKIILVATSF